MYSGTPRAHPFGELGAFAVVVVVRIVTTDFYLFQERATAPTVWQFMFPVMILLIFLLTENFTFLVISGE